MIKETEQTARWVWGLIRNPDVVWIDPETKEEVSRERWPRFRGSPSRWATFRPIWMYYAFTTKPACGCRKRFGIWNTIWCMRHGFERNGDDSWLPGGDEESED
jgi:hypothetical protein